MILRITEKGMSPWPLLSPHFGGGEVTVTKQDYQVPHIPQWAWDRLVALAVNVLEPWRAEIGRIKINRMYADTHLNELQGGVDNSQHTLGEAGDCDPLDTDLRASFQKLISNRKCLFDQAIIYPVRGFIHVSHKSDRLLAGAKNRREKLVNPFSSAEARYRTKKRFKVYHPYERYEQLMNPKAAEECASCGTRPGAYRCACGLTILPRTNV